MFEIPIKDKNELLALHKVLMAAKFHPESNLPECQGNPLVASIANRVCETLIDIERAAGNIKSVAEWEQWRTADMERLESKLLLKRISESNWWPSADESSRRTFINAFMAPLKLNDKDIQHVIEAKC
jgi:hypothetical protein